MSQQRVCSQQCCHFNFFHVAVIFRHMIQHIDRYCIVATARATNRVVTEFYRRVCIDAINKTSLSFINEQNFLIKELKMLLGLIR